ncbi:hypothetical protein [Planococcus sp. CAU13]|uniref:hypothetical protein n=1 Tax=Planococcus sp. CAU13 TaxID=1541197 RepID=UPI00052FF759|nr:hypothetical protein [Planococcus sp. CAU13]
MKYKVATAIGVILIVGCMFIETSLRHNSLNPVGTELTNAGIIIGAIVTFTAGFLNRKSKKKRKNGIA